MSSTFIPLEAKQYDGVLNMGSMGWQASLYYGDVLALCVPNRPSPEEAKRDCTEYADKFGWKILWKEVK